MSTTATRLPLAEAIKEAEAFRALFGGCFDRWEIAGSVRRQKRDVGDIEHVVIARYVPDPAKMFDDARVCGVRLRGEQLLLSGVIKKHNYGGSKRWGMKYFGVDFRDRLHEVFLCAPENFGCILTIRTGSADFSAAFVTRLRSHGHRQADGCLWKMLGVADLAPPNRRLFDDGQVGQLAACPDEATYFAAAGLDVNDWPPERRERLT